MKIFLIIFFIILVFIGIFCLWAVAKISGITTNMEEQMEIERKLRESYEEGKSNKNKK